MRKPPNIRCALPALGLFCLLAGGATLIRKEQIEDAFVRKPTDTMSGSLTVEGTAQLAHIASSTGVNTLAGDLRLLPGQYLSVASTAGGDMYLRFYGNIAQLNGRDTINFTRHGILKARLLEGSFSPGAGMDLGAEEARWSTLYGGAGNFSGNVTLGDAAGDAQRLHGDCTVGTATAANTFKVVGRPEGFVLPLVFSTTRETLSGSGYGYYGALRGNGVRGWIATGAGSVLAWSGTYSTDGLPNDLQVRKNGSPIWSYTPGAPAADAAFYKSQAKDTAAFAAGDGIEVHFGAGVYDAVVTLLVIVDSWDDEGGGEN